jgi:hypothetical protein
LLFSLLELHNLGFLFIIGGLLAIIALRTLHYVKEEGEMPKEPAIAEMRAGFKTGLRGRMKKETILSFPYVPVHFRLVPRKAIERFLRFFF